MSKEARSLFVFAIYLIFVGLAFMVIPNVVLPLFGLPLTAEVWPRVAGMLALFLAVYYIHAARNEFTSFIKVTVYVRASVTLFFLVFVLLKFAPPTLMIIAVVDLAAALWTWFSLPKS
jgi:hypothetical protein